MLHTLTCYILGTKHFTLVTILPITYYKKQYNLRHCFINRTIDLDIQTVTTLPCHTSNNTLLSIHLLYTTTQYSYLPPANLSINKAMAAKLT